MILTILFWIIWFFCIFGVYAGPENPRIFRASSGALLILIGILGWKLLGNPLEK